MSRKIIMLKYNGRINVPEETQDRDKRVIANLLDLMRLNVIEYHGWHNDHGGEFDNQEDFIDLDESDLEDTVTGKILVEDVTWFQIRLTIDTYGEHFNDDEGQLFLKYVYDALNESDINGVILRPASISNYYEREYNNYLKTVIEIIVK